MNKLAQLIELSAENERCFTLQSDGTIHYNSAINSLLKKACPNANRGVIKVAAKLGLRAFPRLDGTVLFFNN